MSSEALAWAFKQDVKPSAVKFTLVALCECANYKTGDIHPSIEHLVEITGQDRKTIIGNIAKLEALGFIADTGARIGRTKQIKVYRACLERVPNTEQSQERNSSVSPPKQSQIRDTEPSREPSLSEAKASSSNRPRKIDGFPCPVGVDAVDWDGLLANRKAQRAPMNAGSYQQILSKLNRWAEDGWPPGPIVANAVERGWRTVFETDEMKNGRLGRTDGATLQAGERKPGGVEQSAREALAILNSRNGDRGFGAPASTAIGRGDHGGTRSLPSPDSSGWDDERGPPRMVAGSGA